jgi:hypothetical protein
MKSEKREWSQKRENEVRKSENEVKEVRMKSEKRE